MNQRQNGIEEKREEINDFLHRWHHVKEQIAVLEKKLDNYKKYATKIMNEQNTEILTGDEFTLTKKELTKRTIGKNDLPLDLYLQYSKVCSYESFYLTQNQKEKKKKVIVKNNNKRI